MRQNKNPEKTPPISFKRWKSMIYKNRESLIMALGQGITTLIEKADQMGLKAVSMHIIFLRTSVANNRPYFRIYLFDKRRYNGNTDCWVDWHMPVLIDYAETVFPIVIDPYTPGYKPKIQIMEQKRMKSAEQLFSVMREMVPGMVIPAYENLKIPHVHPVYFGEYMVEQALIYSLVAAGRELNA